MKTSVEGDSGPTGSAYIELPYIVSEPLQIYQQASITTQSEAGVLKSILIQLCLNVSFSEGKRSSDLDTHGLCRLPFWTEVTRAPVESQAASKPKSLLLLGFWFRLIRISQWFSCQAKSSSCIYWDLFHFVSRPHQLFQSVTVVVYLLIYFTFRFNVQPSIFSSF